MFCKHVRSEKATFWHPSLSHKIIAVFNFKLLDTTPTWSTWFIKPRPDPRNLFIVFFPPFSSSLSLFVAELDLPLFIAISPANEQMTCHLEHLEHGVKLWL